MRTKIAATLLLISATGCATPLTLHVVDLDNNAAPIAGATVQRFALPRHKSDPWSPTPTETQTTDSTGTTVFAHDSGRFVVTAPGKSAKASFFSTFAPATVEVGVGSGK